MKTVKYIFLYFSLLIVACQKDPKAIFPSLPDRIIHTDIEDDTLRNARGRDTTISRTLDVNSDQIADLSISLNTYLCSYSGTPSGGPCTAHYTKVVVSGGTTNKTCCIPNRNGAPEIKFFAKGEKITENAGNYQASLNYLYSNDGRWFYYDFSGEAYLAFCLQNHYYGWIRLKGFGPNSPTVIIKEYAVNMTADNAIIAGQTE